MTVVKHNAPLRDVDWFDITYDCPKWGTTGTRVSREQLKTIDGRRGTVSMRSSPVLRLTAP